LKTRPCTAIAALRFHTTENDQLIAYTKTTPDLADVVLTVVNVDPHHTQAGMVTLPLEDLGIRARPRFPGARAVERERATSGTDPRNYVEINPPLDPGADLSFPPPSPAASMTSSISYDSNLHSTPEARDPHGLDDDPLWYKVRAHL